MDMGTCRDRAVEEKEGLNMAISDIPQRESDRIVYQHIKEGKLMTAAELREKTGFDKYKVQSCLLRLYHNGYIEIASRDRKKASTWRVK